MQRALRTLIVLLLANLTAINLFGETPYVQPVISSSAIVNNTAGNRFTLSLVTDQAATAYYVVSTSAATPSAADIRAGNISAGAPAAISGSFGTAASPSSSNTIITGLTAGTTYYVYFIVENAGNEQSGVVSQTATATDTTLPTYNSASILNVTTSQFDYRVNISENVTVYYVLTTSNTAPSAAQIKAGNNQSNAPAIQSGNFTAAATTNTTQPITALSPNTTYYVYSVAVDPSNNTSAVNAQNATTASDTTPPVYTSSGIMNITENSFDYRTVIDEDGTIYYVVTTSATPPTGSQILAGNDNTGSPALRSGNYAATANINVTTNITGLTAATTYYVYSIARDASNNTSPVSAANATTTADTTPPTYTSSTTLNVTTNTLDYRVRVNENATVFYVITTSNTAPTQAQVLAGNDNTGSPAFQSGSFAATANTDATANITGLAPSTTYYIYSVARDAANNTSTVDTETVTTTADTTPPSYLASTTLNVSTTDLDYQVRINEASTVYYVVTTSNTTPTQAQIIAGNNNLGNPALASGNFPVTANTNTTVTISGLTAGTTYYIYSVARDAANNTSTVDTETATTLCSASNVTAATTGDAATTATLNWTNPGCFDQVLVVARLTNPVTAAPSGDGSGYTANAAFGTGTALTAGQYAVYKGTGTTVTVTGLTDGNVYHFTIFTRKGTSWSAGVTLQTAAGAPRVTAFSPADNSTGISTDQVFTITFNENVVISTTGAANPAERIVFDRFGTTGDLVVQRNNAGPDGTISVTGNVATITLSTELDINTAYDIIIGNRVFRDASSNHYAGTTTGNWNFTTTSVGTTITAPTIGACTGQYSSLGNIVVTEGNDNNFQGTDDGTFTLVLSFNQPGYIFNPSTTGVTASVIANGDLQSITVTSVTFSQATFTLKFKDVGDDSQARNDHDAFTISGLKVTTDGSGTPPASIVLGAATNLTIQGVSKGTTALATITAGTVPPAPTATWTANKSTYCEGTNLGAVTITASGGTAYNWYSDAALTTLLFSNQTSRTASQLFGATPGNGTFTRYVTNVNGCESAPVAVTLTITPNPVAEAGTVAAVCPQAQVELGGAPTATGGGGSYTYAWTDGSSYSSTVANPVFNTAASTPAADVNTVYTVTVTDVNGCTATDNVTVTVKGSSEAVIFTEPNTFFYTTNNNPVNLKGSPTGGTFSGVGVIPYNGTYQFDPEVAGIGSWPVTYTTTLANGCTKTISQNFDVSAPFEVFAGLGTQYCNNEGTVNLTLAPAMVAQILNYIDTWNNQYVPMYGYSPLKASFKGIVRNTYSAPSPYGFGNNNSVVKHPSNATYTSGGQTLDRYQLNPGAFTTDNAYPGCTTCSYATVAIFLEFDNPLFTYPYNIPVGTDQGSTFNTGTSAAFSYTSQYVAINPVPVVFFSGLKSGLVNDAEFCNTNVNYNLTGNKVGGLFEISSNGSVFDDDINDGILNTTAGNAQFNPLEAFGSAAGMVTRHVRYSVDPGTDGSTGQGCIGRSTQTVRVYPSSPISFAASVDPNNKEYCYEAPGRTILTSQSNNVTFTGFGIADNGNSSAQFIPQVAFDQKDPAATTSQNVTISATYTNNIGCQSTITRNYIIFPKPQSTYTITRSGSPVSQNFCYNETAVSLNGNQPSNSTQKYTIDYISSLGHVENVTGNTLSFEPKAYFDKAVTYGNSNVGDAQFNISYIVTDQIGCTASTSKILTVSPLAEIIISGINDGANFCSNTTPFGITFAPSGGELTVDGVTSTNKLDANNTLSSINIPIGTNREIVYLYRSGLSQCVNTKTYYVSNIPAPDAKFSTVPTCDRDEVTFAALPDANSYTWKWVLGDSIRSGTDKQTIKHIFPGLLGATQTSYTIKLVSQNAPSAPIVCRDSAEAVQVIGAYPKADFNYANLCHDDFTKFTITSDIPIATAEWNFGDSFALANNPLNTNVPAGTHGGRTGGKFGSPEHRFSFTNGVANRYQTRLIARTAAAVGACRDTVTRQVAILEKLTPTPANPYLMSDYTNIEGLWLEEDRGDSSTWTFDLPTGKSIITNTVGQTWITNNTGKYKAKDNSYVNSPCFNLSAFTKPVFSLQYFNNTDLNKDGAVLQYSLDGGATWLVLGNTSSGLDWYNEQAVSAAPGGQNQLGWSGRSQTAWKTGKNSLDGLNVTNVRFRIAFASDERDQYEGFAFNNVRIEERNRIMLIEHFTNVVAEATNNNVTSKTNFNTAPELSNETVRLQYHTSFPGPDPVNITAPADHNARTAYYGIASENVPAGYIDGARNTVVSEMSFKTNWYKDATNKRSLSASPFTIQIETLPAGESEIKVHVITQRTDVVTNQKLVLHIALIEKSVDGNNQFVVRKMLPSAAGTPLVTTGTTFEVTYTWPVNYFTNLSQLAAVAFIQDETTREVLQAGILANPDPATIPSIITGIETAFGAQVNFFPNPANHTLNIELSEKAQQDVTITLVDAFGREAITTAIPKGRNATTLTTTPLAAGVYIVQLKTSKGILRRKIIVAHE